MNQFKVYVQYVFKIPSKDEEIAVVSHNDPHAGNMMMDRNDTTAESLILIDWDLTQYGYRPSLAYPLQIEHMCPSRTVCVYGP